MKKPISPSVSGSIASGDRRTDDDVVLTGERDSKILNVAKSVINIVTLCWRLKAFSAPVSSLDNCMVNLAPR